MSTTTLSSPHSSSHLLYEEDDDEDRMDGGTRRKHAEERMKSENTILIETFLTHFLRYRKPHSSNLSAQVKQFHPPWPDTTELSSSSVSVCDFEIDRLDPSFEDLQAILSEILALKVRYKIHHEDEGKAEEDEEEKLGFFIVKVPATSLEDRQLASMATVDHREILFYTQTVIDLEEWIKSCNVEMKLSLSQCYHAQYDRPLEQVPVQGVIENLGKAESILILEDLRPQGFGKRHYAHSLSLSEVKTALREICKIHATSWAMQEMTGKSLRKQWPFHYKPEYGAMLYEALLEDGLPRFENHLRELVETNRDLQAAKILERLILLRSRGLRSLLYKLLVPLQPPAPTTLVHMDFWMDNIFFRKEDSDGSTTSDDKSTANSFEIIEPSCSKENNAGDTSADDYLDCRILDWQMFSVGRPTHDIALLLFTSLDAPTRKDCTDGLIEYYYKTFRSIADKFKLTLPFDLSVIYEQFHRSQLLAVLQVIASIDLVLQDETTQERLMEALLDLIHQKIL